MHFSYAVQEGDRDEDGIGIPANALATGGGTITDAEGAADADLTHAAEGPWHGSRVDGGLVTIPAVERITIISYPASEDTYELGEVVSVRVEFDGAVQATGDPQVALIVGTRTRYAAFSGWGRDSLYFRYTVQEGDLDQDGIGIPANALVLRGGSITAPDGTTAAELTHPEVGADGGSKVDGSLVTAPRVTSVSIMSSPGRGDTYELGEAFEVQVEFDRAVTVTGNPRVALMIGSEKRYAAYWSRGGTTGTCTSAIRCRRRTATRTGSSSRPTRSLSTEEPSSTPAMAPPTPT